MAKGNAENRRAAIVARLSAESERDRADSDGGAGERHRHRRSQHAGNRSRGYFSAIDAESEVGNRESEVS